MGFFDKELSEYYYADIESACECQEIVVFETEAARDAWVAKFPTMRSVKKFETSNDWDDLRTWCHNIGICRGRWVGSEEEAFVFLAYDSGYTKLGDIEDWRDFLHCDPGDDMDAEWDYDLFCECTGFEVYEHCFDSEDSREQYAREAARYENMCSEDEEVSPDWTVEKQYVGEVVMIGADWLAWPLVRRV